MDLRKSSENDNSPPSVRILKLAARRQKMEARLACKVIRMLAQDRSGLPARYPRGVSIRPPKHVEEASTFVGRDAAPESAKSMMSETVTKPLAAEVLAAAEPVPP